jgi:ElaA protein
MIAVRPVASPVDWEACKAVRFEVFVDEQHVPAEMELDEDDATARHWLAVEGDAPIGTARAVAKPYGWKVGRVAVRAPWRGKGVGNVLMRAIAEAARAEGVPELYLESQTHAIGFYERLGYVAEGPEFMDAGIPHRGMRQRLA